MSKSRQRPRSGTCANTVFPSAAFESRQTARNRFGRSTSTASSGGPGKRWGTRAKPIRSAVICAALRAIGTWTASGPSDSTQRRAPPGATDLLVDLVRLERAVIGYRTPLLPPIDLAVKAGETLGVLGPNGAGKTALLKSLLGLLPLLGGRRVLPHGRAPRVGYVPQRDRLDQSWPLSVLDVVLMGRTRLLGPLHRPADIDRKRSREALEEIGVGDLDDRPLYALSAGQPQRVHIPRAIAAEPELLVLDEPTSAMDPAAERVLLELVERLK